MRSVSREPRDGGSQVLLVPSQIDERDQLGRVFANLLGRAALGVVDGNSLRVEP